MPRPLRAIRDGIDARGADIVHLMYPDVSRVNIGRAGMVIMWHDNRVFTKYASETQTGAPRNSRRGSESRNG